MTGRIEKTVFISYRRTNLPWALFVYQNLTMHGYDVFFDYQSIDSGNFETVILDNIRARAHFIVILTPSALENCNKPGDWLRREIETAIDENRNIVPLMVENFDFGSALVKDTLTGKLSALSNYNGLSVPNAYALEAMDRLRERYLNIVLSDVHTQILKLDAQKITENQKSAADEAALVKEEQLTAQTWYERGFVYAESFNHSEAIRCFTEAIQIEESFVQAIVGRGFNFWGIGEFKNALADFNKAIKLNPNFHIAYYGRSLVRTEKGDKRSLRGSLSDCNKSIRLQPDFVGAYFSRGRTFAILEEYDKAITDFNFVIQIAPSDKVTSYLALKHKGNIHFIQDDLDNAITNYSKAIKLKPQNSDTYIFRALAWGYKGNYLKTIKDYKTYLDLGGGIRESEQAEVEELIKQLKIMKKRKSSKKKSKQIRS